VLVLSRRPQESFRIGHDVVITVLEVSGDKVRIGIDAPANVKVHRQEVYLEVQRANEEAAAASPTAAADLAQAIRGDQADRGDRGDQADRAGETAEADDPDGTDRTTT
jgi:carbon storage regulator